MNKIILSLFVITVAFTGNVLFGQGGHAEVDRKGGETPKHSPHPSADAPRYGRTCPCSWRAPIS